MVVETATPWRMNVTVAEHVRMDQMKTELNAVSGFSTLITIESDAVYYSY
jgi:hypothetical protein